eukprot:TRINITY_DN2174_c0_g1_i1.p3 TRINITY_DN2174_c0_g1~~TRINITY_DN2174_c0_g1_i1.p3  ORF type:complete len:109 (+),score=9.26 TRINITY_DN2174_c0_g1_i1:79-405(+)
MSLFSSFFGSTSNKNELSLKAIDVQAANESEFAIEHSPQLQRRSSKELGRKDIFSEFKTLLDGKHTHMKSLTGNYYDNVKDNKKELTVWEQIVKADNVKAQRPDRIED